MKSWFVAFAVLTLVLSAVPAAADEHEFVGAAEGTALKLTITPPGDEPQGLTFGLSSVVVQSSPSEECEGTACAAAAAAVEPFGDTAEVVATNRAQSDSAEGFTVPDGLNQLLDGSLGVAAVEATPAPAPTASGSTTAGALQVVATNTIIQEIEDLIGTSLNDVVDQVVDGLEPVLGPITGADPTGITPQVEDLIRGLPDALRDFPLAEVRVGSSTADAEDSPEGDPGVTTATATAEGGVIVVLPVENVADDGLFQIEVGDATATATTDGQTGATSSKGSIVRLLLADLSTPEGDDYVEVDIASDEPETCVGESPLMLCIIAGGTADEVDGPSATAVAAAVRIRLLADADDPANDNPLPGLTLAFAEAIASVDSAIAVVGEPPPPPPDPEDPEEPTLPATGGGLAALGLVTLLAGGLTAAGLRRRS